MILLLAALFGLFLSYANGANDNFKGVATLYGSATTSYRLALIWATTMQILGSITALVLAQGLLATFSGKGLLPDSVVGMQSFALAVGLAAACTVMLATKLGFPISTTHALTGALVGAGLLASGQGVAFTKLGSNFFMPLLVSPVLAIVLATVVYLFARRLRAHFGVEKEMCICVGTEVMQSLPLGADPCAAVAAFNSTRIPTLTIESRAVCVEKYKGNFLGVRAGAVLDFAHYFSGGTVCFARALNDTPKIAATLLVGNAIAPSFAISAVAVAMATGGYLNSKKIAETVAHKVTTMNAGQGFSANLVTSFLVIFASKLGLPVSTTHVSVGALFGIGTITRQAKWKTIISILLAWVITLPMAALFGASFFLLLKRFL